MIKLKSKKKIISIVLIISLVISVAGVSVYSKNKKGVIKNAGYTSISKKELIKGVSVSGNVESKNSQNVYSTLSYQVKEIKVDVGDEVTAGQTLAILDTDSLKLDIAQQKSTIESSQKTNLSDLNSKTANYENAKNLYDSGSNSELITAEKAFKQAEIDLASKEKDYKDNKVLFEAGVVTKNDLDKSEKDYKTAQLNYSSSLNSYDSTKTKIKQDLNTAEFNLNTAQANYANDSQKIALQKLEKNLEDSVIKAPISGTVTAVYAKVGSSGNGLLFIIEDTDNLTVTTYVKEYDIEKVHPGQLVNIKSDATGDKVINGKVVSISPASTKDNNGNSSTSSNVTFKTEVEVSDENSGLKIGMNARLNIILDKKENIYAVPYDAITTNANNEDIVYILTPENGKLIVKEAKINKGLETDLYTEISGSEITDGTKVISTAASVKPGDFIEVSKAK